MKHLSILSNETFDLEGALFAPDVLQDLKDGKLDSESDFKYSIPAGTVLSDEYGRAFHIAVAAWKTFLAQSETQPQVAVRNFARALFRDALGYTLVPTEADDLRFRLAGKASVPIFFTFANETLDTAQKRFSGEGLSARRRSLSQFAQEFLNLKDEYLWAIVTNGKTLRLLRDNNALSRPCYAEFDLERILFEERYADFAFFWRLLYRDRAGTTADAKDSVWEKLRDRGAEQGVRVFNDLRDGVVASLLLMGNGFLKNPANEALRSALSRGELTGEGFFAELLRVAYRFLFLFAAEERNALHAAPPASGSPAAAPTTAPAASGSAAAAVCSPRENAANAAASGSAAAAVCSPRENAERAKRIYWEGYSLQRLADRTRRAGTDRHRDLWEAIRIVFRACAAGEPRLAIPALGGIFRESETPHLGAAMLENQVVLNVMEQLRWTHANGARFRVDYRNMGAEELGSVYESLLELVPVVTLSERTFGFVGVDDPTAGGPRRTARAAGNERKTTGSYYTPTCLVEQQVKSVVDPLIRQKLAGLTDPAAQEAALLGITLLDPACGSGHFLLAGARRIAERLAQIRAGGDDVVTPAAYKLALRDVVEHCLYGVDLNPMALELAKIALWIETIVPGRPLTFLDAHFVCGNSILGISRLSQLEHGIPQEAYETGGKRLADDDKTTCELLRSRNGAELRDLTAHPLTPSLFATPDLALIARRKALEAMPSKTLAEIEAQEQAWSAFRGAVKNDPWWTAADLYAAAFLEPKAAGGEYPTTGALVALLSGDPTREKPTDATLSRCAQACAAAKVFHWPLVFPLVFSKGGFDCILANPPWDRIKLQEKEFFATRYPAIAESENAAKRKKLIKALETSEVPAARKLIDDFNAAVSFSKRESAFVHTARYPLTGIGDVNLYALFAELILQILAPDGRAGIVCPTGICTDNSTKTFFGALTEAKRLESIYDFENRQKLFPSVDSRFKFSLLAIGRSERPDLAFFLTHPSQLDDAARHFTLTADEFALVNPNTRTAPVCRTGYDAELLKKIYRKAGVLVKEGDDTHPEVNPWGIEYKTLFHMSNDSRLFVESGGEALYPLYEAKMMHIFDHRWATFTEGGGDPVDCTAEQKADPNYEPRPEYWVSKRETHVRLADIPSALLTAAKKGDLAAMRAALANWVVVSFPGEGLTEGDIVKAVCGEAFFTALPAKWYAKKFAADVRAPLTREELGGGRGATALPDGALGDRALPLVGSAPRADRPPLVADDAFFDRFFENRSPKYAIEYRVITNATNSRSVISTVLPISAAGHSLQLAFTAQTPQLEACLMADFNSFPHDWVARQKIAGVNLTQGYNDQIATLPPSAYTQADIDFIVPRVLELTYTSRALKPWAEALGFEGAPYRFDEARRAVLKAELDAYYARLYGLTEEEFRYILDSADVKGPDFPSESFRTLRDDELRQYGEYRTRRLALEAWERQGGAV